jgi:hypothetical protein
MALRREEPETLETKEFVTHVRTITVPLLIFMAFGVVAGLALAVLGVILVLHGSVNATSSIHMFGQTIDTTSVGVACIAISALVIVLTFRRVLTSFDNSLGHFWRKRDP